MPPQRLEIMLKPEIRDPEGETLKKKAREYLGIKLEEVRTIQVLTFDTSLTPRTTGGYSEGNLYQSGNPDFFFPTPGPGFRLAYLGGFSARG